MSSTLLLGDSRELLAAMEPGSVSAIVKKSNHATALRGMVNGAKQHEQRIHTPMEILRPIAKLWPEGIACDPCGSPDSLVDAGEVYGPEFKIKDSLLVPWPDRSFVNPPYDNLKAFFAHGMRFEEQAWLIPVRSHRSWWRDARAACDVVAWLSPIAFVGFDQSFPAALAMFYRGRRRFDFHDLFSPLGRAEFEDRIELVDQGTEGAQGDLF